MYGPIWCVLTILQLNIDSRVPSTLMMGRCRENPLNTVIADKLLNCVKCKEMEYNRTKRKYIYIFNPYCDERDYSRFTKKSCIHQLLPQFECLKEHQNKSLLWFYWSVICIKLNKTKSAQYFSYQIHIKHMVSIKNKQKLYLGCFRSIVACFEVQNLIIAL